jgi:hypothetical protein
MTVRLSAHTAVAIAILLSCGGGGGGEEDDGENGSSGIINTGGFEPPPPDFDRPPGQDTPPSDYDDPSDTLGCGPFCQAVLAKGCTDVAPTRDACVFVCTQEIVAEDCPREILALLTCAVNAPEFTCDSFDDEDSQGAFEECEAQASAYARCLDRDGGGEGGQGGM